MAVINSKIPTSIRPHGSSPSVENIYTDSGAAENLKNRVCNKIIAGTIRNIHVSTLEVLFVTVLFFPGLVSYFLPVSISFSFEVVFVFVPAFHCIIKKPVVKKI